MHLPPTVWGPFFWHTIHIIALGYSDKPSYAQKKAAKEFYESLAILIPCPICREHFSKHLETYPLTPHLDRRKDLFKWTVVLHNEVNKSLNKPLFEEHEVIKYYTRLGARARSPVINHTDFEESDTKSFLKGVASATAAIGVTGGLIYLLSKS